MNLHILASLSIQNNDFIFVRGVKLKVGKVHVMCREADKSPHVVVFSVYILLKLLPSILANLKLE